VTRSIAIVSALVVTSMDGEADIAKLLLPSQVALSLQLPFAVLPLIRFTSSKAMMGPFASSRATVATALTVFDVIVVLDAVLIIKALA
jgi:manganese transport protein